MKLSVEEKKKKLSQEVIIFYLKIKNVIILTKKKIH